MTLDSEFEKLSLYEKINPKEKAEWIKNFLKLQQQEKIIEKTISSLVATMKIEEDITQSIVRDQIQLMTDRHKIADTVKQSVQVILNDLDATKSVLNDSKDVQELDTNNYKQKLLKLARNIEILKKSCPLQTLMEEEVQLETELNEIARSFSKFDNCTNKETASCIRRGILRSKSVERSHTFCREVQDFNTLVARTGHTENWSEEDHLLFLKLRIKYRKIPKLVRAIKEKCPDLSTEDIVNHEAWYKVYLELREKQKLVLEAWRKEKELEKSQKLNSNKELEKGDKSLQSEKVEIKNPEKLEVTTSNKNNANIHNLECSDETNRRKKEMIKKWKLDREHKRSMDNEQLKRHLEFRKNLEQRRKEARMKKVLTALNEYKNRKVNEKASVEYVERLRETQKDAVKYEANHMIKLFRQKDEEYVKRRLHLVAHSQSRNRNKCNKSTSTIPVKSRNCSTLFDPTKVWIEKCKNRNTSTSASQEVLYIKNIPKLRVTNWRNRESTSQ
ncbi:coiled-coil domain-containing protein 112-like [Cephus cinctus]|uniref:Coiled-coil domain-containing protein 112-like n=1 Tax=Cephus cinctus TaxID=211228 RepID=A0AAJ7C760_CEPCN|nr:coiled-coil domain-containing protein 112-like [Cephus cinctus]